MLGSERVMPRGTRDWLFVAVAHSSQAFVIALRSSLLFLRLVASRFVCRVNYRTVREVRVPDCERSVFRDESSNAGETFQNCTSRCFQRLFLVFGVRRGSFDGVCSCNVLGLKFSCFTVDRSFSFFSFFFVADGATAIGTFFFRRVPLW